MNLPDHNRRVWDHEAAEGGTGPCRGRHGRVARASRAVRST